MEKMILNNIYIYFNNLHLISIGDDSHILFFYTPKT